MDMMNQINAQMLTFSPTIQAWMNWMVGMFLLSIFFVWRHKAARCVLLALVLTMPLAMIVFYFSHNVNLFGIPHLIVWMPLVIYLYKTEIKNPQFKLKSPYGIWLVLLSVTIVISLVFDIRDVILVAMGQK